MMAGMLLDDLTFAHILTEHGPSNWLLASDGTLIPYIRGGADDGGDGGDTGGDGSDQGAGGAGDDGSGGDTGADGAGDEKGKAKVEMTQAELDALIAKRVAKATSAAEQEAKTKADREKMDEATRLKAEKAEADKKAADATSSANARIIKAEAKVQAVSAGADAKQVDYVLKLADLSDITVGDDGEPDAKAIRKAIDKVLTDLPALKATANGNGSSGGDHTNGHAGAGKPTNLQEAIDRKLAATA